MNATTPQSAVRRPQPRELTKILGDCRDLAIHRLLLSFAAMLDRIGDMLMERANHSDVREEAHHFLAARSALLAERVNVMAEFERRLRDQVDNRIAGDAAAKPDFSTVDASNLTLIDITAMDESVITGNITRVIENFCHDELQTLDRAWCRPDRAFADHDRATRSRWRQLDDAEVFVRLVVDVDREADLLAVEGLRPVDIGDRDRHELELVVHRQATG